MELEEYLAEDETVYENVPARRHVRGPPTDGALLVTDRRLLFVTPQDALDLDLDSIEAVEYRGTTPRFWYLLFGGLFAVAGLASYVLLGQVGLGSVLPRALFAAAVGLVGLVVMVIGRWQKQSMLRVATGVTTHKFTGDALAAVPKAVREDG